MRVVVVVDGAAVEGAAVLVSVLVDAAFEASPGPPPRIRKVSVVEEMVEEGE